MSLLDLPLTMSSNKHTNEEAHLDEDRDAEDADADFSDLDLDVPFPSIHNAAENPAPFEDTPEFDSHWRNLEISTASKQAFRELTANLSKSEKRGAALVLQHTKTKVHDEYVGPSTYTTRIKAMCWLLRPVFDNAKQTAISLHTQVSVHGKAVMHTPSLDSTRNFFDEVTLRVLLPAERRLISLAQQLGLPLHCQFDLSKISRPGGGSHFLAAALILGFPQLIQPRTVQRYAQQYPLPIANLHTLHDLLNPLAIPLRSQPSQLDSGSLPAASTAPQIPNIDQQQKSALENLHELTYLMTHFGTLNQVESHWSANLSDPSSLAYLDGLNAQWTKIKISLGVIEVGPHHPLKPVHQAAQAALQNHGIDSKNVVSITSDNENLMHALADQLHVPHFPESSHSVNILAHIAGDLWWEKLPSSELKLSHNERLDRPKRFKMHCKSITDLATEMQSRWITLNSLLSQQRGLTTVKITRHNKSTPLEIVPLPTDSRFMSFLRTLDQLHHNRQVIQDNYHLFPSPVQTDLNTNLTSFMDPTLWISYAPLVDWRSVLESAMVAFHQSNGYQAMHYLKLWEHLKQSIAQLTFDDMKITTALLQEIQQAQSASSSTSSSSASSASSPTSLHTRAKTAFLQIQSAMATRVDEFMTAIATAFPHLQLLRTKQHAEEQLLMALSARSDSRSSSSSSSASSTPPGVTLGFFNDELDKILNFFNGDEIVDGILHYIGVLLDQYSLFTHTIPHHRQFTSLLDITGVKVTGEGPALGSHSLDQHQLARRCPTLAQKATPHVPPATPEFPHQESLRCTSYGIHRCQEH